MVYWLETDQFGDDPIWEILADGNPTRIDALQAAYCRIKAKAAHLQRDGYLSEQTVLRYARRNIVDLLCTAVLDRPPRLHRPGDDCECLGDTWIDGYAYRVHAFLKRNPSRAETARNRAQKADLRDARLRTSVYARDGGCCRYCRSGPLSPKAGRSRDRRKVLCYDHVDPDVPAGPDGTNLVVACGRCNEHKGRRTPPEADMLLLSEPSLTQRAAWAARGQALFDPGDPAVQQAEDHPRISDETATNHRHDADRITDRTTDQITGPGSDHTTDPGPPVYSDQPPVRPQTGDHRQNHDDGWSAKGPGAGRSGHPAGPPSDSAAVPGASPTAQPARHASAPDIYHRRSRAPTAPPPPHYLWPPGTVPAQHERPDQQRGVQTKQPP